MDVATFLVLHFQHNNTLVPANLVMLSDNK
jgi:hypothetical protein